MVVSLEDMKNYLRVDTKEDDVLITTFIQSAENLCYDILREKPEEPSEGLKVAVMYGCAYLYEHREEADYKALIHTLKCFLSASRKEVF